MKIKLAILENDKSYLNRIVSVFSTKYTDKFQVFSFTNQDMALKAVVEERIDVFIASDLFEINVSELPPRCSFAYFVNNADIEIVNDSRAICKFQKVELIYKNILSLYSENASSLSGFKSSDECQLTVFSSPCGGVGTSTVAAAYSMRLAKRGKRVLFICYEDFGAADLFFKGEGQFDMSDVIFALKSKKSNLALKLESYVRKDIRGVHFFAKAKIALDMIAFSHEERLQIINELRMCSSYDHIVVDLGRFGLDSQCMDYYKKAQNIVIVSDGSENANTKVFCAYNAIATLDQSQDVPIANKFALIYNKVRSQSGRTIEDIEFRNIGGFPVYSNATTNQIMEQISLGTNFDKLD